jgi:exodeoxyribonuclease VII large subunit
VSEGKKIYTLLQLNRSIKNALETKAGSQGFWVKAEIANLNKAKAGHYYLELVEESDGRKQAAIRGTIWAREVTMITQELGDSADRILSIGSEIVFRCKVIFHEVFGMSLNISEIDLTIMLGELEKRKKATIETITKEGRREMNKMKPLPSVVHKVAIIGSPGTSGFRDFMLHVLKNEYRYRFEIDVIATKVQGAEAAVELKLGLDAATAMNVDVVVMVRGGGSPLDLDCFNDLELAMKMSEMEIPVLTGIGHETDICVADLVAHKFFKTPTDVGDFLVDRTMRFESLLIEIATKVGSRSKEYLSREKKMLDSAKVLLGETPKRMLNEKGLAFENISQDLTREIERVFVRQKESLQMLGNTMELLKPEKTLSRGYSILRKDGKAVVSVKELGKGDQVEIQIKDGKVKAQIN